MTDKLLNKLQFYENKIIKHCNDSDKLQKYNNKYNNLVGGNIEDDLNLLKHLEIKNNLNETSSLLDYQKNHAQILINILEKNNVALDASEPGIGKTYIASFICQQLNLIPIVICPKNVISSWTK